MKSKMTFISVVIIFASISILVLKPKFAQFETKVDAGVNQKQEVAQPVAGFGKFLKAARVGYRSTLEQDSKIPKECLDFFDALQKIDFLSMGNNGVQLTYQVLPEQPENCKGEFIPGFTAVQQDFIKKCKPENQNLSEPIGEECSSAVFMLRAAVTRLALKDKPLNEITDMAQLTDLVFSELGTNSPKMKAIAERMLELDPTLFAAHKINVMSNLIEGFMAKDQNQDASEGWKHSADALAKAREVRPNDEMLDDADTAIQTKGFDPALTRDLSQKMTQDNPANDRGWFLLAYAQWKQGDHEASITNLNHAIALAPNNQDYKNTRQEISKPGATADSFKGAFKVSIGSDDFNH